MRTAMRKLFMRELDTLEREVDLYPDDASLWKEVPGLSNPGGNLALHLVGNLRHFIGAQLGHTGFVRDRDAEFSTRGLSRAALKEGIARARQDVASSLDGLDDAALGATYPMPINGITLRTDLALMHLEAHLAFHLGQIDYHRRAATGDRTSAGALGLQALEG